VKEGTQCAGGESKGPFDELPQAGVQLCRPGSIDKGGVQRIGGDGDGEEVDGIHFLLFCEAA